MYLHMPPLKLWGKVLQQAGTANLHSAKCAWKDKFELECILSHRGDTTHRQYLPCPIERILDQSRQVIVKDQPTSGRDSPVSTSCPTMSVCTPGNTDVYPSCDLPFKSQRGIKIHSTTIHKQDPNPQPFKGKFTEKQGHTETRDDRGSGTNKDRS